jgi:hypothetical protein
MTMKRQARLLILAALLPLTAQAQAQGVRDAAGNVIIRDDVAASRGMDPNKPLFVYPVTPPGTAPSPVGQAPVTRSASVVTLPANTATQIAPAGLKSFAAQVQGSNPVIIGYDNTVCTGTGITLAAANGTQPGQSSTEYPASTTAYWACSVAGSSVAVVRGQ